MLFFRDVVDAQGSALQSGLTDDAASHLQAGAFDLGGVADLEAHPELLGAVVDQQDGEDAIVDDGADQVGDAMHQGVEIERGVEGVGERVKELDLVDGIDADIWSLGVAHRCAAGSLPRSCDRGRPPGAGAAGEVPRRCLLGVDMGRADDTTDEAMWTVGYLFL